MRYRDRKGFTLIELMIVVAIIGILAAVAVPKFADLIRKSNEGATRGNLGSLRSALSIYYGNLEGMYPADVNVLTVDGKYIDKIPTAKTPNYHGDSAVITNGSVFADVDDAGGWVYGAYPAAGETYGQIYVNCLHTDSKAKLWFQY